jgi:uncharacterized protein YbaP (TraB family)
MKPLLTRFAAGLALVAALALAACGGDAEPERDWPAPSPALWQVAAPGEAQGWLFGTIHALPDEVDWRTPALDQALRQSLVLVVEVAEIGDADEAARQFARRARAPGLPPLLERVPVGDRAALQAALDAAGLHARDFAEVESWAASLQLANALRRYDSANGVDRGLIAEADRVIGLETLGRQFALFDGLSPEQQARLLAEVAREGGGAAQEERVEAWLTGDLDRLARDAGEGLLADPALRETLQLGRNRAWAERVATLVAAGERPLVAVGAAHMLGDQGLPALLAARGYTVRRIQ